MAGPNYNAVRLNNPEVPFLIFFDFVTAVFLLAGLVYLNILFFKKKKIFPKYFMVFLIVSFVVGLLKYWARPSDELEGRLGLSFITGIIWVSYFLISRRVKATFVR